MPMIQIKKIVSGGQTGVDRAALDIARYLKIPYGGWCPKNRWAEDGPISADYSNLIETSLSAPEQRTEWNVRDSDGTLVIVVDPPIGSTQYTIEMAQKYNKPYYVRKVSESVEMSDINEWIKNTNIHILNVAGPRESQGIGIYEKAYNLLRKLLTEEF